MFSLFRPSPAKDLVFAYTQEAERLIQKLSNRVKKHKLSENEVKDLLSIMFVLKPKGVALTSEIILKNVMHLEFKGAIPLQLQASYKGRTENINFIIRELADRVCYFGRPNLPGVRNRQSFTQQMIDDYNDVGMENSELTYSNLLKIFRYWFGEDYSDWGPSERRKLEGLNLSIMEFGSVTMIDEMIANFLELTREFMAGHAAMNYSTTVMLREYDTRLLERPDWVRHHYGSTFTDLGVDSESVPSDWLGEVLDPPFTSMVYR